MNSSKIVGVVTSVTLHLVILFLLFYVPTKFIAVGDTEETNYPKFGKVEVKLIPITESAVLGENNDGITGKNAVNVDRRLCNDKDTYYSGVGVILDITTHRITHVPEYYPGYKAGIRVGDFVVDTKLPVVNGYIDFEIIRGYNTIRLHIKTTDVCFNIE